MQLRMYDISNGKANGWSWILGTHFPAFWHTAVVVDLPAPWMNITGDFVGGYRSIESKGLIMEIIH